MHLRPLFALFLVLLPLAGSHGDTPFPVLVLETEFKKQLAASQRKLDEGYRLSLEKVQAEYAAEGDLDGALLVKAELAKLETPKTAETIASPRRPLPTTAAESTESPTESPQGLLLSASQAEVSGSVKYDPEHQLLVDWKDTGGARWPLQGLPPGRYSVYLSYHSGPFAGGHIAIQSGTGREEVVITGSGLWKDLKQQKLCELSVTGAKQSLALTILSSKAPGIMDVRSLEFVRGKSAPAPTGSR